MSNSIQSLRFNRSLNDPMCFDCAPTNPRNRRLEQLRTRLARGPIAIEQPSTFDKVMSAAEKVSVLALGILSAMADIKLFIPFFLCGLGYGIYSAINNENAGPHQSASACSQGFLEQITGIRLPRPVSLIANVAITACHIDHHSSVFVPITALSFGAWVGKNGLEFKDWVVTQVNRIHQSLNPEISKDS
ncbi:MAG: hypothetical protein FJZ57_05095 [Chlamydiae bacterium]|nr:hypothetical protein [Chlamydiota bacterium]